MQESERETVKMKQQSDSEGIQIYNGKKSQIWECK